MSLIVLYIRIAGLFVSVCHFSYAILKTHLTCNWLDGSAEWAVILGLSKTLTSSQVWLGWPLDMIQKMKACLLSTLCPMIFDHWSKVDKTNYWWGAMVKSWNASDWHIALVMARPHHLTLERNSWKGKPWGKMGILAFSQRIWACWRPRLTKSGRFLRTLKVYSIWQWRDIRYALAYKCRSIKVIVWS